VVGVAGQPAIDAQQHLGFQNGKEMTDGLDDTDTLSHLFE
jgi:hypothetical protein